MKWLPHLVLALLLLCLVKRVYFRFFNPNLIATFFDVGQGDAALIQLPYGKTWLVDAGGGYKNWNIGKQVLFKELTRNSILTLNHALLSHPDQDHSYGFEGLRSKIKIENFWIHDFFKTNPKIQSLQNSFQSSFHFLIQSQSIDDNMELIPLWPPLDKSTNNHPLVLKITYKNCSLLFTGDMEQAAEKELIKKIKNPITVLKIAHHGSKTSTLDNTLQYLQPSLAIISSGEKNIYGHPHPSTLWRLLKRKISTFRTDFHGYIQLTLTPNGEIYCDSFQGPCGSFKCLK